MQSVLGEGFTYHPHHFMHMTSPNTDQARVLLSDATLAALIFLPLAAAEHGALFVACSFGIKIVDDRGVDAK